MTNALQLLITFTMMANLVRSSSTATLTETEVQSTGRHICLRPRKYISSGLYISLIFECFHDGWAFSSIETGNSCCKYELLKMQSLINVN